MTTYIRHLHSFRGFAILNVVALHAFSFATFGYLRTDGDRVMGWLIHASEALLHDSTIYFALISGLLFSQVLQQRGWAQFASSKLRNVISPYVVLTVLLTLVSLHYPITYQEPAEPLPLPLLILHNLVTGNVIFHFWYLPVLAVLFALTPLVSWLVRRRQRGLLMVLVLAPLVSSRTFPDEGVATVVYFLGVYTVGIWAGAHYGACLQWVGRHATLLIMILFATTAALMLYQHWGFDWLGPVSVLESVHYVQKLALAALALRFLHLREGRTPRWLDTLATHAFAIYFLHGALCYPLFWALMAHFPDGYGAGAVLPIAVAIFVITLSLSLAISVGMRRLMGRHSRMVIGS